MAHPLGVGLSKSAGFRGKLMMDERPAGNCDLAKLPVNLDFASDGYPHRA